jgi:hypothetical protein
LLYYKLKICKNGPKIRTAVLKLFHDLKNVKIAEKDLKIGQFLPILANLNHVLKKVGEGASITYFQGIGKFDM